MKRIVWVPVLLLVFGAGFKLSVRAKEPVEPERVDQFLDLLKKGDQVLLTHDDGGYAFKFLKPGQPAPKPLSDVDVRYAARAGEVAKAEYQRALDANRKLPGTISQEELQRLKWVVEGSELQLEQAKQLLELARLRQDVQYEVVGKGRDFVALRNTGNNLYVPVTSIRSLAREIPPAPANAEK